MNRPTVMFIAGDPSGDMHAAEIIGSLAKSNPSVECFGIGGPCMHSQGFKPLMPFEPFNKMGFAEVIAHLPFFLKAKKNVIFEMKRKKPSVLVCVDYPGFNIPIMKEAKKIGIPVIYYIVPQVWAWKKRRAADLGNNASFIGVVFPFEEELFKPYPAPVRFVGHPLVEVLDLQKKEAEARDLDKMFKEKNFRIALIPGSRPQEIKRNLEPMTKACALLKTRIPSLKITVSRLPQLPEHLFLTSINKVQAELFSGPLNDLLLKTDLAFVTSGTATLQTALHGIPMVIVYKTSFITYSLLKNAVSIEHIGMPNIIAGKMVVPECIQGDASPQKLAENMDKFISSQSHYTKTSNILTGLKEKLGAKCPSSEISSEIENLLQRDSIDTTQSKGI